MNNNTRQTITDYIMPAIECPISEWTSGEQFANDVIALADMNWDGELPSGVERDDLIAYWQEHQLPELLAVMTTSEAAAEFGIEQITVIKNIERGNIPGRKSGGTWLIRRADAERRWGNKS